MTFTARPASFSFFFYRYFFHSLTQPGTSLSNNSRHSNNNNNNTFLDNDDEEEEEEEKILRTSNAKEVTGNTHWQFQKYHKTTQIDNIDTEWKYCRGRERERETCIQTLETFKDENETRPDIKSRERERERERERTLKQQKN